MIKGETITVYNWHDIRAEICRVMGIHENQFRDYHRVVGGDYKDLWHVAMDAVVPQQMANGTIVTMYSFESSEEIDSLVEEHGDWTRPFFVAYHSVMDQLDPEFHGVEVRFSW